jgi:hypothetical protein
MVQRMRTSLRAQHVVSTIIFWCRHASSVGGDLGAKQGEFVAERGLQPAHEPCGHTGILPCAAVVLPSLSEFSPSYSNVVPEHWRDVIVAGRGRKSSAPLVRGPLSRFVNWPLASHRTEPVTSDASSAAEPRNRTADFSARVLRERSGTPTGNMRRRESPDCRLAILPGKPNAAMSEAPMRDRINLSEKLVHEAAQGPVVLIIRSPLRSISGALRGA